MAMANEKKTTTCLRLFAEIFRSHSFLTEVDLRKSKIKDVLQWIHDSSETGCVELKNLLSITIEQRKSSTNLRSLFKEGPALLIELGTNQMLQIFKVALSFAMFAKKDKRIEEMFDLYVANGKLPASLLIGSNYIPAKTATRFVRYDPTVPFSTHPPKPFEVIICIHAMNIATGRCGKRGRASHKLPAPLRIKAHYNTSNRIGFAVQLLFHAWTALAKAAGLQNLEEMIAPYIIFESESGLFRVLSRPEDGFAPSRQRSSFISSTEFSDEGQLSDKKVDKVASERSTEQDHAFRQVTATFFQHLQELVTHPYLYECDTSHLEWKRLDQYRPERGGLPSVFRAFPKPVLSGLGLQQIQDLSAIPAPQEVINVDSLETDSDTRVEAETRMANTSRKRRRTRTGYARSAVSPHVGARTVKTEDEIQPNPTQPVSSRSSVPSSTRGEREYEGLVSKLFASMSPLCRVHDVSFRDLIDTDADESGFYLDGKVDFIVTDPPYNTRRHRFKTNSAHDVLTDEDMKACVFLFDKLMKKGAHGLIFCSSLQFHKWFRLLKQYSCKKKGKKTSTDFHGGSSDTTSDSDSEENVRFRKQDSSRECPFHVEEIMMHFQNAPGHYNRSPAQFGLGHMSVVQTAVHFWKKGLPIQDALQKVKYEPQGHISSRHSAWTNCVDNIPRIDAQDRVYFPRDSDGRQGLVRPEQKSVQLLMELISQYTREGDLVVDMFGGTFSAAKACLRLAKHRKFVGCDSDKMCVQLSMPSILLTYAKQMCSQQSNIVGTSDDMAAAAAFLNHPRFLAKQAAVHASPWDSPSGLPLYQRLPEFVHRYLSSETMDPSIAFRYRLATPEEWPNKFRACLNAIDVKALLNIEAAARGFVLCKSSIRHHQAGAGVFAARAFQKGDALLSYYGTLVYQNLCVASASTKEYGSGILAVRKERFAQTGIELSAKVKDDDGKEHRIFIVPAPFCLASFVNDPRYLPGDEDWMELDTVNARKANVAFTEPLPTATKNNIRSNRCMIIEASRDIQAGEELFVHYGSNYVTWGSSTTTTMQTGTS